LNGKNACDIITAYVISGDTQTNRDRHRKIQKSLDQLATHFMRVSRW